MGGFGFIFWLLILVGISGALWFFGSLPKTIGRAHRSTAWELLEERYGRGEINREEYLQKSVTSRIDLSVSTVV